MKYALAFLAGTALGLYGGAWVLGVWLQATPEFSAADIVRACPCGCHLYGYANDHYHTDCPHPATSGSPTYAVAGEASTSTR